MKHSCNKVMAAIAVLCCLTGIVQFDNRLWAMEYKGKETAVPYRMLNKGLDGTDLTVANGPIVRDNDIIINNLDLKLVLVWELSLLFGEPVVSCKAAAVLTSPLLSGTVWVEQAPTNLRDIPRVNSIPKQVLEQIRIYNVEIEGTLTADIEKDWNTTGHPVGVLPFDPGVFEKPFIGKVDEFQALPDEEKKRYFSYNTPESPDWSRLFYKSFYHGPQRSYTATDNRDWLDARQAKDVFTKGVKIRAISGSAIISKASFNLSGVKKYCLTQKKADPKKLKEFAEIKNRKLNALEKEKKSHQVKESVKTDKERMADFFDTFEDERDYEEIQEETFAEKKNEILKEYTAQVRKFDGTEQIRAVDDEQAEIDRLLAAKREEIKNRKGPEPNTLVPYDDKNNKTDSWDNPIASRNNKSGYKNAAGQIVIPAQFFTAGEFSEGRARVIKEHNGNWGYIDTTGKMVVPAQFTEAENFSEGLAAVAKYIRIKKNRHETFWGVIDTKGQVVIPFEFEKVDSFSEGLAYAIRGYNNSGFIDKTGRILFSANYKEVRHFSEGLAAVLGGQNWNQWGFINKSGKLAIPCKFYDVKNFSEGLAGFYVWPASAKGRRWGFINYKGQRVIPAQFKQIYRSFSEGRAVVRDKHGACVYIDKTGKTIGPAPEE